MNEERKQRLINAYDLERRSVMINGHRYVPWLAIAEVETAETTERHTKFKHDCYCCKNYKGNGICGFRGMTVEIAPDEGCSIWEPTF